MRHDRREAKEARPDMTCVVDAGRLFCSEPVRAGSWRAWIVPESVARRAGAELLKAALEAGLPDTRSASWR
jgi:colicin import membrane protein